MEQDRTGDASDLAPPTALLNHPIPLTAWTNNLHYHLTDINKEQLIKYSKSFLRYVILLTLGPK